MAVMRASQAIDSGGECSANSRTCLPAYLRAYRELIAGCQAPVERGFAAKEHVPADDVEVEAEVGRRRSEWDAEQQRQGNGFCFSRHIAFSPRLSAVDELRQLHAQHVHFGLEVGVRHVDIVEAVFGAHALESKSGRHRRLGAEVGDRTLEAVRRVLQPHGIPSGGGIPDRQHQFLGVSEERIRDLAQQVHVAIEVFEQSRLIELGLVIRCRGAAVAIGRGRDNDFGWRSQLIDDLE
jgi:hypothetical protein